MDVLEIERLGGIAGFGGQQSRIRSRGTCDLEHLEDPDRRAVEQLFTTPSHAQAGADGFLYRLTRRSDTGVTTIEVPETNVPAFIRQTVRDELL